MKRIAAALSTVLAFTALTALAQEGKDLFLDKCAACHGQDGEGKTAKGKKLKMKSVKETTAKMSAADMVKIVENGKGTDMDAYAKQLSKAQIQSLVDYYRSLAK